MARNGLQGQYETGWHTPIIGPIWMTMRRRLHQEIRICIDVLLSQQSSFNSYLVRAFDKLMEGLADMRPAGALADADPQAASLDALRQEIADLKKRVQDLERDAAAGSKVAR